MAYPVNLTNAVDNVTEIVAAHLNNLETKVGIDSSAVATSLDYLLKNPLSIEPGHKHSSLWASDGDPQGVLLNTYGNLVVTSSSIYIADADEPTINMGLFAMPDPGGGGFIKTLTNHALSFGTNGIDVLTIKTTGVLYFDTSPPTYADNAAALSGGLVAKDVYKTSTGELRIVV